MTGRIDRLNTAQRTTKLEPAEKAKGPQKVAGPRGKPPVSNQFSQGAINGRSPNAGGQHVATSARPDALWGAAPQRTGETPAAFVRMTPTERAEKLTELRATRDELQGKILERVVELDKKWDSAPATTKEEALRKYAENSEHLDPETKQELDSLVHQAEVAQRRIDRLRSRRDGLPPSRHATAETKARRAELNAELRAARKEHRATVKEATAVVDEKGLKVDRLAVTEQVIDPNAPKEPEKSLLGMVKEFFKIDWMCNWLSALVNPSKFEDERREAKVRERDEMIIRDVQDQSQLQSRMAKLVAVQQLAAADKLRES